MSNFAKEQLKKYGWKEGKGLGKNENGIVKPIKATLKSDLAGLGYNEFFDNWWEKAYDKSVKNIQVETRPDEVSLSVVDEGIWEDFTKKKKKKPKAQLGHCNSQEADVLHNDRIVVKDFTTSEEEKETTQDPVNISLPNERLHTTSPDKVVASKAARCSVSVAKLDRIALQESLLMAKLNDMQSVTPDLPSHVKCASQDLDLPSKRSVPDFPLPFGLSHRSWLLSGRDIVDNTLPAEIMSDPRLTAKCILLDPPSSFQCDLPDPPSSVRCNLPDPSSSAKCSFTDYYFTDPVISTSPERPCPELLSPTKDPFLSDYAYYHSSYQEFNALKIAKRLNTYDRTLYEEEEKYQENNNTFLQALTIKSKSRSKRHRRKMSDLTKLFNTCSINEIDKKSEKHNPSNEKKFLRKIKKYKKECIKIKGKIDNLKWLRKQFRNIPFITPDIEEIRYTLTNEDEKSQDEKKYPVQIIQIETDDDTSPKEESEQPHEQIVKQSTHLITLTVKSTPQCDDTTSAGNSLRSHVSKNLVLLNSFKKKNKTNKKRQRSKIEDVIKNITNKQNANIVDVVTNALKEINLTDDASKTIKKKPTQTHTTPV